MTGLGAWTVWLAWRAASLDGVVAVVVFPLELAAFVAAALVVASLWTPLARTSPPTRGELLPVRLAGPLGVPIDEVAPGGRDDTGEAALARHALALLDPRTGWPGRRAAGWAVLAIEGARRQAFVAVLVVVLLTGRFPFPKPPPVALGAAALALPMLAAAPWLLSGGRLRPGDRLVWSMASIGAGLGDGVSRSGLPIRWAATMATMVVLNVAVSLRGVSDRWTHGLGPMTHDERVASMLVATGLVLTGLVALRSLPHPSLAPYGATRRLEEGSTRRLALGATFGVAAVGLVAGMLPAVPA